MNRALGTEKILKERMAKMPPKLIKDAHQRLLNYPSKSSAETFYCMS